MKRRVCSTFIVMILTITFLCVAPAFGITTINFASGAITPPPGGSISDPNVEVSLDGGFTWTQAYTTESGPWPAPISGSRWDSPSGNPFDGFGLFQEIRYRTSFVLPGGFGIPVLSGSVGADDQPVSVSLNGTHIADYPYEGFIFDPAPHPFGTNASTLFVHGTNVVEFVGLNLGGASGLYFTGTVSPLLPISADECRNGAWRTFEVFRNQGDCVSFVATGGHNPPRG